MATKAKQQAKRPAWECTVSDDVCLSDLTGLNSALRVIGADAIVSQSFPRDWSFSVLVVRKRGTRAPTETQVAARLREVLGLDDGE